MAQAAWLRVRVRMVHDDSGGVRLADKTLLFMTLFDAKSAACYTYGLATTPLGSRICYHSVALLW